MTDKKHRLALHVVDFGCVSCAREIRKKLVKRNGVTEVKTNPILNDIYIYYEPALIAPSEIEDVVEKSGYKVVRTQGIR